MIFSQLSYGLQQLQHGHQNFSSEILVMTRLRSRGGDVSKARQKVHSDQGDSGQIDLERRLVQ